MSVLPTVNSEQIAKNEDYLVKHLAKLLNIILDNPFTILEIKNKLKRIDNAYSFLKFTEERFNYSKYEFKTGEQKLILLFKDYEEEVMYKLADDVENKIFSFSQELYKKASYFFNELNFISKHENINLKVTIENPNNGFKKEELKILDLIEYERAYRLAILSPAKLEQEIEESVRKQAKLKHCPMIAIDNNKDKKVLERLKYGN